MDGWSRTFSADPNMCLIYSMTAFLMVLKLIQPLTSGVYSMLILFADNYFDCILISKVISDSNIPELTKRSFTFSNKTQVITKAGFFSTPYTGIS